MEKQYESRDGTKTVKVIEELKFKSGATALLVFTDKKTGIATVNGGFPTDYGFSVNKYGLDDSDAIEIKPDLGLYFWAFEYASTKDWVLQGTAYREKDAEVIRRDHGFINKRKVFKLDV